MSAVPTPALPDERLAAGAARLATRHAGRFGVETVRSLLTDSYRRLAETASVTTHLVVLAERLTTERLDALAHAHGAPGSGLPGCCSCAATTPAVPSSPPRCCSTGHRGRSRSLQRALTRRRRSSRTSSGS
ncbi:three-helix bundle dimerization domain-containing protein [Streptomyces sp. NPDC056112]|uniref:three-helix bundle dimerization domain-containing protein n=1 Tax=Streptomyces sp. NPDC056112 TaxID=3345715 RepID=UPI0035D71F6B